MSIGWRADASIIWGPCCSTKLMFMPLPVIEIACAGLPHALSRRAVQAATRLAGVLSALSRMLTRVRKQPSVWALAAFVTVSRAFGLPVGLPLWPFLKGNC